MRRSARGEQSAFSLFPFLAVLLCTMGAMVVLLVAMAHVSRAKAKQEAELAAAVAAEAARAADSPERRALEQRLAEAEVAAERVRELNKQGNEQLREEQQRISDIESHLAKLRDEADSLVTETRELVAVEEEHYDDEKIAEQELERLHDLIGEIQDEIEELKHAATGRERTFAVVPLRDERTGTLRPPVYFECSETGVVLQPEGIELGWRDLVAIKFSSPVTAASRAITRHYEEHPEARAANEVGKPYPLLIIRPDGINAYYQARAALEAAGTDFGYQPVADDWPLEYGEPNPLLYQAVEDAVQTARAERAGLSELVPELGVAIRNAERNAQVAMSPESFSQGNGTEGGPSGGAGIRVKHADPDANNPFEGLRIEGTLANASGSPTPEDSARAPNQPPFAASSPGKQQGSEGFGGDAQGGYALEGPAGAAPAPVAGGDPNSNQTGKGTRPGANPDATADASQQRSQDPGAAPGPGDPNAIQAPQGRPALGAVADGDEPGQTSSGEGGSGKRQNTRNGVPMVRPIRLVVSKDRVALAPDRAQSPQEALVAAANPQGVDFQGPTTDRINDLIALLKQHAESWGIAGRGMYWDPRLILNVTSDGAGRADDLRRLLEAAGLQVQAAPAVTAAYPTTNGGPDATRR